MRRLTIILKYQNDKIFLYENMIGFYFTVKRGQADFQQTRCFCFVSPGILQHFRDMFLFYHCQFKLFLTLLFVHSGTLQVNRQVLHGHFFIADDGTARGAIFPWAFFSSRIFPRYSAPFSMSTTSEVIPLISFFSFAEKRFRKVSASISISSFRSRNGGR